MGNVRDARLRGCCVNLSRRELLLHVAIEWDESSNLFRERIACQRSRKFPVYEILVEEGLFAVEFVCSWPISREVREYLVCREIGNVYRAWRVFTRFSLMRSSV